MKRLVYISRCSFAMTEDDIDKIRNISKRNNRNVGINGLLLYSHGMFFQIMEGKKAIVDQVFAKIKRDQRHTEVLCIRNEENITEKYFADWSMTMMENEQQTASLIKPMKLLLDTIFESYDILKTYTQPAFMQMMHSGVNPLKVESQAVEKIIMFSDIRSFSTFVEKRPITEVESLVNCYFSICTQTIHQYHGEVCKFIGDCVMSYFDIEYADNAIQAALSILNQLHNLRYSANRNSLDRVLYSGIGLAQGLVIQCNMGSELKKDFTLLGDAVNIASRLESLTREMPYHLIFNQRLKQQLSHNWQYVDLGLCYPKGKEEGVKIYSINDPITLQKYPADHLPKYIKNYLDEIDLTT